MTIYISFSKEGKSGDIGLSFNSEALCVEVFRLFNCISDDNRFTPGVMKFVSMSEIETMKKILSKEKILSKGRPESWNVGETVVSSSEWKGSRIFQLKVERRNFEILLATLDFFVSCAVTLNHEGLYFSSER